MFGSLCLVFYSDMEPLSKYAPVTLHLSLATKILSENPVFLGKVKGQGWR